MTIKAILKTINSSKAFNKLFVNCGECIESTLEIWVEKNNDKLGIYSQEEATELIKKIIKNL